MDLLPEWRQRIIEWARPRPSINEVWLFGSRSKGTGRSDSDVDIGLVLAQATGHDDPPLGTYVRFGDEWQRELIASLVITLTSRYWRMVRLAQRRWTPRR